MQQRTAIIAATGVACLGVGRIGIVATAEAQEKFTGCLKDNGRIVRVAPGENPTKPCKKKQTQIMFPGTETTDRLMEKDAGRVRFVFVSSTITRSGVDCPNRTGL